MLLFSQKEVMRYDNQRADRIGGLLYNFAPAQWPEEDRSVEDYIERKEHEEFCKRMEEEHRRQNRRIELLEETTHQISALTSSVEKLAVNMENMLKSQEQQGKRLEALESRDGEMWRKVVGYLVTAVVGIVIGYIFKQIGM